MHDDPPNDEPPPAPTPRPMAPKPPGLRIGPIVFVLELAKTSPSDPWAHRKGEPRPLALLWVIYLTLATALTIFAVHPITVPTQGQFIYASRALIVMIMVGITVLWPMVRLSQQFPRRAARSVLIDALVVFVPAALVTIPMQLLTRWPGAITLGLLVSIASWTALIGSVLVGAYARPSHWARTITMLACVACTLIGPALVTALHGPGQLLWLSPFTSVFQITTAPSGLSPAMEPHEWLLAAAPLALALPILVWGLVERSAARNGGGTPT